MFTIQVENHEAIDTGLLYYCKSMPIILLINICTVLSIINDTQSISYQIII